MAWLLIGLGNPGPEYSGHRHNIGFMVVDAIAEAYKFSAWKKAHGGALAEGKIDGMKVHAFKPMGYMNTSGGPAGKVASFYKIPPENIIAFHDELDLPLLKLRVKTGGGNGGHNGLKSLDAHIGPDYRRVRIGIAHPGDKDMVSDYVLSNFSKVERKPVASMVDAITRHIGVLIAGDDAGFMNKVTLDTRE